MLIYSETIYAFIAKCEKYLKEIIHNEVGFDVKRSRFLYNKYLYPIHIVVFEGEKQLGYFDPHHYQIGLNKCLIYTAKEKVLKDILRHEFAHYLCFLYYPEQLKPHGQEFNEICDRFKWSKDISAASLNIEQSNNLLEGDLEAEKVIAKVKKLLSLAQSDNINEAQAATAKANQLLIKHNLNYIEKENFETLYVDNLVTQKRKTTKLMAIYDILKHFLVRPILSYGKGQVTLEVTGLKGNIELAHYIYSFLDNEFERLWKSYAKENNFKGQKAKNSFFYGIAKGYDQKINETIATFDKNDSKNLIILNKKLDLEVQKIYRRLSSTAAQNSLDANSFHHGKKAGANLTINKGIKSNNATKLLGWFS